MNNHGIFECLVAIMEEMRAGEEEMKAWIEANQGSVDLLVKDGGQDGP
jgi:hypothetical protein